MFCGFSQCSSFSLYQLETALKLENGSALGDDPGTKSLVQQNVELRRKLEDEHASYKRKLQAYQDGQQRQAQLVQKLQAKVTIEGTILNYILRPRLFSDQVED